MNWKLSRILNERKIERRTKAFWTRAQGLKEIERKRFFHLSASALKLCSPDFILCSWQPAISLFDIWNILAAKLLNAKLQIMIKRKRNPRTLDSNFWKIEHLLSANNQKIFKESLFSKLLRFLSSFIVTKIFSLSQTFLAVWCWTFWILLKFDKVKLVLWETAIQLLRPALQQCHCCAEEKGVSKFGVPSNYGGILCTKSFRKNEQNSIEYTY